MTPCSGPARWDVQAAEWVRGGPWVAGDEPDHARQVCDAHLAGAVIAVVERWGAAEVEAAPPPVAPELVLAEREREARRAAAWRELAAREAARRERDRRAAVARDQAASVAAAWSRL